PAAPIRPTNAPNGCPSTRFDLYAGDPGFCSPSASEAQPSTSHDSLTNPRAAVSTWDAAVTTTPVSRYSICVQCRSAWTDIDRLTIFCRTASDRILVQGSTTFSPPDVLISTDPSGNLPRIASPFESRTRLSVRSNPSA